MIHAKASNQSLQRALSNVNPLHSQHAGYDDTITTLQDTSISYRLLPDPEDVIELMRAPEQAHCGHQPSGE